MAELQMKQIGEAILHGLDMEGSITGVTCKYHERSVTIQVRTTYKDYKIILQEDKKRK